ncbi:MAG: NAD(P)H-dependent oxidoreductase [Caulobacterales bacterium]
MQHAVILAHPNPQSFNAAVARAYCAEIERLGHQTEVRDLYALGFDPRLQAHEFPWAKGFHPGADVVAEREVLTRANVIVFVYPFWFNSPPAMLKGFVDRVFGMGFGYEPDLPGTRPLLGGKVLVSISTSGAPQHWVDQTGALRDVRARFDGLLSAVCGLTVFEHLHLGGVTPGLPADDVEEMLERVAAMARHYFGPPAQDQ